MRWVALCVSLSALLAGCVAEDPEVRIEPAKIEPDVPDPEPEEEVFPNATFDGVLVLSVGTPAGSANPASEADEFLFVFEAPANATSSTVTMTWTPAQSTAQNLHLLVEKEDGTLVTEGSGASPLVVTFDTADLGPLRTRTFASSGGLAKDQPFHLEVTFS